jgi:hypothetical protein
MQRSDHRRIAYEGPDVRRRTGRQYRGAVAE